MKKTNQAFVLDGNKAEEFFKEGKASAKKAMDRFNTHQPKPGVQTPYKGSMRRGN